MEDLFDHEAFSLVSLTAGFNASVHIDTDVLNMFKVENVENRTVMIVKSGKQLQVLMPVKSAKIQTLTNTMLRTQYQCI
ncbi:hypothetical protein [Marinomonas rhodophyticola]|uniref:Uncharacterized protein n=1 Tax=Marinomonas rhodophyticola TaxID=2992803 RepID=A0ABT3KGI3_9GAMM|nr:hypothetical protein [Marinomonas sp. KJ51-3]MCW4629647.1 hypothetical protein [Marinomonas sp. KJ51-3]